MARKSVSEKTLELNISSELLNKIRNCYGCSRAFWFGMKQLQEARHGIDELILNVPRGRHLALQFKSPRANPRNGPDYNFSINDTQNNNLLRLATNHQDSVFYVFPAYNTFQKMRDFSPVLLDETYFSLVADTRGLLIATNQAGRHTVYFVSNPPSIIPNTAIIYSEPLEIKLLKASDLFESDTLFSNPEIYITHEELQNWFGYLLDIFSNRPRKIGQMLRGFSTICMQD